MAHYSDKTCEKCGYKTHRTFNIPDWEEWGICADCVVDILTAEQGDGMDISDVEISDESPEV